jgi:hypothetical protein
MLLSGITLFSCPRYSKSNIAWLEQGQQLERTGIRVCAPIRQFFPILVPFRIVLPIPINDPSPISQPWSITLNKQNHLHIH